MQLSASMDVVVIVIVLLVIITGYIVSSYQQYTLLKKIDKKLTLLLDCAKNENGKPNHTNKAENND